MRDFQLQTVCVRRLCACASAVLILSAAPALAARVGPVSLPLPPAVGGLLGGGGGGGIGGGGGPSAPGGPNSGGASPSGITLQTSGDSFSQGADHGPDGKWGDPLSMDLLGSDKVHASLRYFGSSDGTGTQQAVGIGLTFPQ